MRDAPGPRSRSDLLARLTLGLTGVSLVAYVPYRYATRPPAFEGFLASACALLFPLSPLSALSPGRLRWRVFWRRST